MNRTILEDYTEVPYLGLRLSNNISWARYICNLSSKLSQKLGVLKGEDKVPKEMLNNVYKTIIQPHIDYCITVWGYVPYVHIDNIQRIQCRAARLVSGVFDYTYLDQVICRLIYMTTGACRKGMHQWSA